MRRDIVRFKIQHALVKINSKQRAGSFETFNVKLKRFRILSLSYEVDKVKNLQSRVLNIFLSLYINESDTHPFKDQEVLIID